MKYLIVLIAISTQFQLFAQDVTQFHLEAADEKIKVSTTIANESLKLLSEDLSCPEEEVGSCVSDYLTKNFMMIINSDIVVLKLDSVKVEDDFYKLFYHIDFKADDLYEVWVKSAFLLNIDETHQCDVVFNIAGREQKMQMGKEMRVTQFYF